MTTIRNEIPGRMKALRYYGNRDLRLEVVEPAPCGPDEVRIKVSYCGICGSDMHEYLEGPEFTPKHGEKHPYNGSSLPVIMGHEPSGIVVEVGSAVRHGATTTPIRIGQRVMINPCIRDEQLGEPPCAPCREGATNLCARLGFNGLSGPQGGMAEYLVVKGNTVFPLPDSIPLHVGALVEPLAVAWHCVRVSGFKRGQDAVVFGAGPIGLALLLSLKVWGARTVTVCEFLENRKALARKFGADYVIHPRQEEADVDEDNELHKLNLSIEELNRKLNVLQTKKEEAIQADDMAQAADLTYFAIPHVEQQLEKLETTRTALKNGQDPDIEELGRKLKALLSMKEEAIRANDIKKASDLAYYAIPDLELELEKLKVNKATRQPERKDPVVVKAQEISGNLLGGGVDVAFDTTGVQATLDTSIACVKQGGTIVNLAIHEKPLSLNFNVLSLTEKKLMGGLCYTNEDIVAVIDALENGALVADEMISSVVSLEEAITGGFEELAHRREKHVKILVKTNVE